MTWWKYFQCFFDFFFKAKPHDEEAKEEAVQQETPPKSNNSGSSKSWASLFHKNTPTNNIAAGNKPMARIQPYNNVAEDDITKDGAKRLLSKDHEGSTPARLLRHPPRHSNPNDLDMAKFLQSYGLNHSSSKIKPRGLSNRSNWCFVNAILQAIVACPSFYNLIKSLPAETMKKSPSMVKIIQVVHDFISEFSPLDHFPKLNRREKGKKNEDLPLGLTFEASSVFQFLLGLNNEQFKVEEGRQEDAEEFLTFLLNGLNDEMLALLKLLVDEEVPDQEKEDEDDDDNSEWHEVGARNKSLLTRRVGNSNESLKSPLGSIFQGQLQSCVQSSNGEPTATLQPFFTLPLDIQSKNIKNVSDALLYNFTAERLDG